MGTFRASGLRELEERLGALSAATRDLVIPSGLSAGASVLADAVRQGLEALPTSGGHGSPEQPLSGPSMVQKEALLDSLGITPVGERKGVVNVKIGFDGYNRIRTRRWPNGQPNQMIARAVEGGTSFMHPNPFMKRAVSRSRRMAVADMERTINEKIEEIMG